MSCIVITTSQSQQTTSRILISQSAVPAVPQPDSVTESQGSSILVEWAEEYRRQTHVLGLVNGDLVKGYQDGGDVVV